MVTVELRFRYCISLAGILKWTEMMVSAIVIGLVLWEVVNAQSVEQHRLHDGEAFTCFTGFFTFAIVFMLLVVWFFNGQNACCHACKCKLIATIIYTFLVIMWIASTGVEVWLSVSLKEKGFSGHMYNRRPAAAAFCIINVLCCCVSLFLAKFRDQ